MLQQQETDDCLEMAAEAEDGYYQVLRAEYVRVVNGKWYDNKYGIYRDNYEDGIVWHVIGCVSSMEVAKELYGGSPVLQYVPVTNKQRDAWNTRMHRALNKINTYEQDQQYIG